MEQRTPGKRSLGTWRYVACIPLGVALVALASIGVYMFTYRLGPLLDLRDEKWAERHSMQAKWERVQQYHLRNDAAPDMMFFEYGMWIGYFGDRDWALWICESFLHNGNYRTCGCNHAALALLTNQRIEDIEAWYAANREKSQLQWILDGFAAADIPLTVPLDDEEVTRLLGVLGGAAESDPEASGYLKYNALRLLRDGQADLGDERLSGIIDRDPSLEKAVRGFTEWRSGESASLGRLTDSAVTPAPGPRSPGALSIRLQGWGGLSLLGLFAGCGLLVLAFTPMGGKPFPFDRVKRAACRVTLPFIVAGRWTRKHHRKVLVAGLLAGAACVTITYIKLPAWRPEWVIKHSNSPERVLRASHFAFNGHFDATPALKRLLGDEFDDFLVRKLSDPDPAASDQAACILAYSRDPVAEEALIETYLRAQGGDRRLSLLLYLGWTATDRSNEFLTGILDGRIDGPRWSALRSLSRSSISDRYKTISRYLNDPDERVRKGAEDAFKWKLKREFEEHIAETAESELFPLARKMVAAHQGAIPAGELPQELAGRPIKWGCIRNGCLDLRFGDENAGLLINPEAANTFPVVNGYLIGGGGTEGISPYVVF